jgi:hypothetical protein
MLLCTGNEHKFSTFDQQRSPREKMIRKHRNNFARKEVPFCGVFQANEDQMVF